MASATTSASLLQATKYSSDSKLDIPLIDLTPLLSPNSTPTDRLTAGRSILHAFTTSGFLYLSAPPIPTPTLTSVFSHSASFFARPQPQKDSLAWTSPSANRGYVAHGREKVSVGATTADVAKERANPDLKESMEIGRDGVAEYPNRWPDEIDAEGKAFREVMTEFFGKCKELHRVVMGAIALGLGYEEGFFDEYVKQGDNTLRLLHYPAVPKEVFEKNAGAVRAGAHTDYGSITLLFQDDRGGLQVQTKDGGWQDVTPVPGTVVVNAGDLLARWSNDRIKSTTHRVVNPPVKKGSLVEGSMEESGVYPARYSVAYFCNPDFDKRIEALPGTWEGEGKKYSAINSGEYLVQRLTATY